MSEQQPPRPPRSLRDRTGARKLENTELPPSDYIQKKTVEKPADYSNAQDYLSEVDQELEDDNFNKVSIEDEEDEPIPSQPTNNKPKVQVLNVRENRKEKKEPKPKPSTENLKIEAQKQMSENISKVKDEFKEIEESFEDTKEELGKIKDKVSQETQLVKAKILAFGIQALEKILTTPKNILMGIVFKKKKRPVEKEEEVKRTDNVDISKNKKQIPKVKYAELLANNIDFITYDKKRFVDEYDSGALMEEIFMANVISDLKYCVRFVGDLPNPTQGHYSGRRIAEIFEASTSEDINKFLYYALKNPETFKRNRFKFSEAYATWLIRKSHEF